jgi:HEAT repeat protein
MTTSWADDPRSSAEIVALALAEADEDMMWELVSILQLRGGAQEYQLAVQLTAAADPKERCLGVDILAQLQLKFDQYKPTYVAESVDILIPMLNDPDISVVISVTYALGHRRDERAVEPLCKLAEHPNSDVRLGVACSLGSFDYESSIQKLLELSSDSDEDVRDWATFALGSQIEADTPEIREALFARIHEDNGEIRGEALVGLATRHDPRALELVRAELNRNYAGSWVLEAAELMGDESLVPLLNELRANWGDENEQHFGQELDQAIAACVGRQIS